MITPPTWSNGFAIPQGGSNWVSLTSNNASNYLLAHSGTIQQELDGTANEIPDFTNLGGPEQLFDFDRAEAAATAGAGQVYANLADFKAAVNAANAAGNPLEGIQFVNINPAQEGSKPKLQMSEGINITGSLVFKFANGTSANYKVVVETPVNVNAADLTNVDFADESTYTTGYPGDYLNPNMMPHTVDITPTFDNYTNTEDLPAVMFNNGIVDFHGPTNICGVVYGPSFIEIENKTAGNVQYFNGAIYGGGGIYLQGHSSSGYTAIRYDSNTTNSLHTLGGKGQVLTRIGFAIER